MEFVRVVPFNSIPFRSLSAEQTADMIKIAAKAPPQRVEMSTHRFLPSFVDRIDGLRLRSPPMAAKAQLRSSAQTQGLGGRG